MRFESDVGLSGHPGLSAEPYSLPISPGHYRIEAELSRLVGYNGVTDIWILRSDLASFREDVPNQKIRMIIQTHGGVVIAERSSLLRVRDYFDSFDYDDPDGTVLWNQFAYGFSSIHTERLEIPGDTSAHEFGFWPCDEYLTATPLLAGGDICGYHIECRCDESGVKRPEPQFGLIYGSHL